MGLLKLRTLNIVGMGLILCAFLAGCKETPEDTSGQESQEAQTSSKKCSDIKDASLCSSSLDPICFWLSSKSLCHFVDKDLVEQAKDSIQDLGAILALANLPNELKDLVIAKQFDLAKSQKTLIDLQNFLNDNDSLLKKDLKSQIAGALSKWDESSLAQPKLKEDKQVQDVLVALGKSPFEAINMAVKNDILILDNILNAKNYDDISAIAIDETDLVAPKLLHDVYEKKKKAFPKPLAKLEEKLSLAQKTEVTKLKTSETSLKEISEAVLKAQDDENLHKVLQDLQNEKVAKVKEDFKQTYASAKDITEAVNKLSSLGNQYEAHLKLDNILKNPDLFSEEEVKEAQTLKAMMTEDKQPLEEIFAMANDDSQTLSVRALARKMKMRAQEILQNYQPGQSKTFEDFPALEKQLKHKIFAANNEMELKQQAGEDFDSVSDYGSIFLQNKKLQRKLEVAKDIINNAVADGKKQYLDNLAKNLANFTNQQIKDSHIVYALTNKEDLSEEEKILLKSIIENFGLVVVKDRLPKVKEIFGGDDFKEFVSKLADIKQLQVPLAKMALNADKIDDALLKQLLEKSNGDASAVVLETVLKNNKMKGADKAKFLTELFKGEKSQHFNLEKLTADQEKTLVDKLIALKNVREDLVTAMAQKSPEVAAGVLPTLVNSLNNDKLDLAIEILNKLPENSPEILKVKETLTNALNHLVSSDYWQQYERSSNKKRFALVKTLLSRGADFPVDYKFTNDYSLKEELLNTYGPAKASLNEAYIALSTLLSNQDFFEGVLMRAFTQEGEEIPDRYAQLLKAHLEADEGKTVSNTSSLLGYYADAQKHGSKLNEKSKNTLKDFIESMLKKFDQKMLLTLKPSRLEVALPMLDLDQQKAISYKDLINNTSKNVLLEWLLSDDTAVDTKRAVVKGQVNGENPVDFLSDYVKKIVKEGPDKAINLLNNPEQFGLEGANLAYENDTKSQCFLTDYLNTQLGNFKRNRNNANIKESIKNVVKNYKLKDIQDFLSKMPEYSAKNCAQYVWNLLKQSSGTKAQSTIESWHSEFPKRLVLLDALGLKQNFSNEDKSELKKALQIDNQANRIAALRDLFYQSLAFLSQKGVVDLLTFVDSLVEEPGQGQGQILKDRFDYANPQDKKSKDGMLPFFKLPQKN